MYEDCPIQVPAQRFLWYNVVGFDLPIHSQLFNVMRQPVPFFKIYGNYIWAWVCPHLVFSVLTYYIVELGWVRWLE
jgi:hypothetical protein